MASSDQQRIGRIGETLVSLLAERAGLVAQAPTNDVGGWGRLLEVDVPDQVATPLDRRACAVKLFVQVKTTRSQTSVPVKLDALERAVKDSNPWVFVFVVLGPGDEPQDVFVVPIGEDHMALVLKRLRSESTIPARRNRLHKMSMSLSWTEEQRVDLNDPTAFRTKLVAELGDPLTYADRKASFRDSVGYVNARYKGTLRFAEGVTNEHLADALVGLRTTPLRGAAISLAEVRFGIPLPLEDYDRRRPFTIELRPSAVGKGRIAVQSTVGAARAELDVDVFVPPRGTIPEHLVKARFSNDIVSMVARADGSLEFLMDVPADAALASLVGAARFLRVLQAKGGCVLSLQLDNGKPLFVGAKANAVPTKVSADLRQILSAAEHANKVLRELGFESSRDMVCVDELARSAAAVKVLHDIQVGHVPCSGRIGLRSIAHRPQKAVFLANVLVPLKRRIVSVVIGIEGRPKFPRDGKGRALEVEASGRILRSVALDRSDPGTLSRANAGFLEDFLQEEGTRRGPGVDLLPVWRAASEE